MQCLWGAELDAQEDFSVFYATRWSGPVVLSEFCRCEHRWSVSVLNNFKAYSEHWQKISPPTVDIRAFRAFPQDRTERTERRHQRYLRAFVGSEKTSA